MNQYRKREIFPDLYIDEVNHISIFKFGSVVNTLVLHEMHWFYEEYTN